MYMQELRMRHSVSKLENILVEEIKLYREIYNLEEEKTEAVIQKNGSLIQELCASQDKLVVKIEFLEAERGEVMSGMNSAAGRMVTLTDIAEKADNESSQRLMQCGSNLKSIILKLKSKQEINSKLLKDNIEFFSILISDLKNSSSEKAGYGSDGKENVRIVNPVLFNTKA